MYIITQNLKNRLKNELSMLINSNVNTLVDNLSDIFETNNKNKYTSLLVSTNEFQRNTITSVLTSILEEIDEEFKHSNIRRKKYVINKSYVSRTITTIFGDITFKRTYYKSKLDNSLHFILDEELGLPKYDRYDQFVKATAVDNAFDTNQKKSGEIVGKFLTPFSNLIDINGIHTIPRQSIHNWINDWYVPKCNLPARPTPDTLFIMVDEKFLGCQDLNNDIMVKAFVSFENIKTISKNRRQLVNRLVFTTYSKNAWKEYVDWLYKIYDSEKIKKIYIMSDGGTWIKSGLDELKTNPNQVLKRLLCEFHFEQSINRMTTDKDERLIINLYFKENNRNEFNQVVNSLINIYPNKTDTITKNLNYILNNYTAIKDMINFNIGSSMESHISHCIASYFASRPKGFSSTKINKYLKLYDYKNNNINIFNLYLNSYNNTEEITLNSDSISFALFENHSSNIPILNSTASPTIKNALYNLKTANAL